jgi:hypothetical protein
MNSLVARAQMVSNRVSLIITRVQWNSRGHDYCTTEVADFSLRFLPDTQEVIVVKGDEIVYSEILS